MRRRSLALFLIAPILLAVLLTQMADVQAARPLQTNQEPVIDEGAGGVPLEQPLSIRIRQQIPISIPYVFFAATPLTTTLAAGGSSVPSADADSPISESQPLSDVTIQGDVVAVTPTASSAALGEVLTVTAVPLPDAGPSAAMLASEALTESELSTPTVITPAIVTLLALPGAAAPAEAGLEPSEALTDVLEAQPLFLAADLDSTPAALPNMGVMLDLDLQFVVLDALTSTVPATVVVRLTGLPSITVPITLALSLPPAMALVNVEPVTITEALTIPTLSLTPTLTVTEGLTLTPPLTETEGTTGTGEITSTEGVTLTPEATPTVPAELTVVTFTVPLTTNVRLTPSTEGEIARRAAPGETFEFVAQNAAGDWYLLREGSWVAQIALGEALTGLPTATDELVAALREEAARATPTPTPTPPAPAEPTPTPIVTPFAPVTVTTTTNANLRGGPGTTFDIVGNTELGQAILIVERNDAGDWLRLQDGSWISAPLVQGAPPLASIPVFDPNATPTPAPPTPTPLPAAVTTTVTTTVTGTPTTGGAALPTPTPRPVLLTVDENLYLVDFDSISSNYDRALTAVDRLVDSASGNAAVLADPQWQTDMNTAIQLIRRAGQDVASMVVPERFVAAHNSLVNAATQYNLAADSLAAGLQQTDINEFDRAFVAIGQGDSSLSQAAAALSAFRP